MCRVFLALNELVSWVARSARCYRRSNWSRPESIAHITADVGAHRFNVQASQSFSVALRM